MKSLSARRKSMLKDNPNVFKVSTIRLSKSNAEALEIVSRITATKPPEITNKALEYYFEHHQFCEIAGLSREEFIAIGKEEGFSLGA
jgi:hypothetical protein